MSAEAPLEVFYRFGAGGRADGRARTVMAMRGGEPAAVPTVALFGLHRWPDLRFCPNEIRVALDQKPR